MIEWRDQGVLLTVRRHGENAAIIDVFTSSHGKYAGVVRGGASRKIAPILQPGAQLDVTWKARLDEHLGAYTVEPVQSRAALVMSDRLALAALNATCGLLSFALPEREVYPDLYEKSVALLDLMGSNPAWPVAYLRWELSLLEGLGFGLDLSCCAVTGVSEDLAYVSPRSGRAVSAEAAGEWADRLLPLPPSLLGHWDGAFETIAEGMTTTGYFLEHRVVPSLGHRPLPPARQRLLDLVSR